MPADAHAQSLIQIQNEDCPSNHIKYPAKYQLQITFNLDSGTSAHQSVKEMDTEGCRALFVKVINNPCGGMDLQYFPD